MHALKTLHHCELIDLLFLQHLSHTCVWWSTTFKKKVRKIKYCLVSARHQRHAPLYDSVVPPILMIYKLIRPSIASLWICNFFVQKSWKRARNFSIAIFQSKLLLLRPLLLGGHWNLLFRWKSVAKYNAIVGVLDMKIFEKTANILQAHSHNASELVDRLSPRDTFVRSSIKLK